MTAAEKKAYKAKQLRYKKPIVRGLNIETIQSELWDMISACEDIHWYDNNEESLVNALDGNEDEAYEFKIAFSDLEAELEQFQDDLQYSEYVSVYFDVLFPAVGARYAGGYLGYDQYEGDYYGLEPYEYSFAEDEEKRNSEGCRAMPENCLSIYGDPVQVRLFGFRNRNPAWGKHGTDQDNQRNRGAVSDCGKKLGRF